MSGSQFMTRTCRYGHGDLERLNDQTPAHQWALMGVKLAAPPEGTDLLPVKGRNVAIDLSRRVFTVTIWRCQECGYLELFDEDLRDG